MFRAVLPRPPAPEGVSTFVAGVARAHGVGAFQGGPCPSRCSLSVPARIGPPGRLEEEPYAALRLVDPHLEQAGRRDVPVLPAHRLRLAHPRGEGAVVLA